MKCTSDHVSRLMPVRMPTPSPRSAFESSKDRKALRSEAVSRQASLKRTGNYVPTELFDSVRSSVLVLERHRVEAVVLDDDDVLRFGRILGNLDSIVGSSSRESARVECPEDERIESAGALARREIARVS